MKKPLFNKITIVGIGLIGGSLGLAVKKRGLARKVVGVVRRTGTIREALRRKAVDEATLDLARGVKGADLVILCASVSSILKHLRAIAPFLKREALVIDVGSSKGEILKAAKKHLRKNLFIGCHPMAGSEKCGIENAKADLFKGEVCFLTCKNRAVEAFWKALGARPLHLGAERHDHWAAKVSHLPHLLSFALLQRLERPVDKQFDLNPSFKEFARLAKSSPEIWSDILSTNRTALLSALRVFRSDLDAFERFLRLGNSTALNRSIVKANSNASKVSA